MPQGETQAPEATVHRVEIRRPQQLARMAERAADQRTEVGKRVSGARLELELFLCLPDESHGRSIPAPGHEYSSAGVHRSRRWAVALSPPQPIAGTVRVQGTGWAVKGSSAFETSCAATARLAGEERVARPVDSHAIRRRRTRDGRECVPVVDQRAAAPGRAVPAEDSADGVDGPA